MSGSPGEGSANPAPMARPIPRADRERIPSAIMRKVSAPLLAYHALILLGAALLIWGAEGGDATRVTVGAILVGAGIAVELAVLGWSASLARSPPSSETRPRDAVADPAELGRWICVGCGQKATQRGAICSRCGRSMIWLGKSAVRS